MEGMSSSGGLEIGISCIIVPHFVTGGQKHTHTHTYDSGANNYHISKQDQCKAGLPILQPSTRWDGVANGGTSNAKYARCILHYSMV
jgi:hypothetical protein